MGKYPKYVAIGLALALTGCATTQPCTPVTITKVQTVLIPIDQTQIPPDVVSPVLYVSTLSQAQLKDKGELVKAQTVTIIQLEGWIDELKAVVDKWKQLAAQNVPVVNDNGSVATSSAPATK